MEKLKADLVKKLLNGSENQKKSEDKISQIQNIKYRYSTPWTMLLGLSRAQGETCKITQNPLLRNKFEVNTQQGQYIFDAAFTKTLKYLASEMDIEEEELSGVIVDKIIRKNLENRPLFEVVEFLKKIHPDMIENT